MVRGVATAEEGALLSEGNGGGGGIADAYAALPDGPTADPRPAMVSLLGGSGRLPKLVSVCMSLESAEVWELEEEREDPVLPALSRELAPLPDPELARWVAAVEGWEEYPALSVEGVGDGPVALIRESMSTMVSPMSIPSSL